MQLSVVPLSLCWCVSETAWLAAVRKIDSGVSEIKVCFSAAVQAGGGAALPHGALGSFHHLLQHSATTVAVFQPLARRKGGRRGGRIFLQGNDVEVRHTGHNLVTRPHLVQGMLGNGVCGGAARCQLKVHSWDRRGGAEIWGTVRGCLSWRSEPSWICF